MITKFTRSKLRKSILLGAALTGCISHASIVNAQCYSQTYSDVEAGTWSAHSPAIAPAGPYNGCEEMGTTAGGTSYVSYYNHDHGFTTLYDGTPTWTWSRDLTGLDPSKTYEIFYQMTTQSLGHRRHLTFDYNLPGLGNGSFTTGTLYTNQWDGHSYTQFSALKEVTGLSSLHFTGNLHCDAYQSCEPAQEMRFALIVREIIRTPVSAPAIAGSFFGGSVVLLNNCPETGIDLSTALASSCPAGFITEWHTGAPVSDANKVANPANVSSGIYAAVCRKNSGDKCYSPISSLVYAATFPCGGFGGFGGGEGGNPGGNRPAENGISFNSNVGNGNGEMYVKGAEELHLKYGTPVLTEGDASKIYLTMDNSGKYVAVGKTPGVYKFNVPLLPPTEMEGEAPMVPLTVTVKSGIAGAIEANEETAYVMPNPTSGNAFSFVYVNNKADKAALNIQMTDVNGRTVYTTSANITKGTNKIQIQASSLAKGIYYLNYTNAALKISGKLKVAIN